MFLKRIELAGFKSFADRTELEFGQGITAVVGPNGSGKSNISDGIRWVLGEQSAKSLRGGKMEDIIFAGSDARKAVNYGEVSITFDNEDNSLPLDFSEVTVTRRVHRSGDSEYLINKQACRLKDITELFMDTGIGREAYSIIGQGRIEEILSTKSEDRRGIFEEASGIVKYKARKKEAQKKLDETEQNLLRIHDLITELEDQIEPLKEQSEKALLFKQLKEELKSNEIALYVHQIEQLHRSWTEANERLNGLQAQQLELSTIVNQHDAHLEKHRLETRRLEEELEQLNQDLLLFSEEFEKCEGLGEVLKERKRNLEHNRLQYEQGVQTSERRLEDKQRDLAQVEHKLKEVTAQLESYRQELTAEEAKLLGISGQTSHDTEEHLKGELLEILNQTAQVRNELKYSEQQKDTSDRRLAKLLEERAQAEQHQIQLSTEKQDIEAKLTQLAEAIDTAKQQYVDVAQKLQMKQKLIEEAQLTVRKWEQKLDAMVSRKDTMKDLQNDFDGFFHGVKEILKSRTQKGGLQGIHGAVAELMKVPAELETAVETALGGALQHIVMEDEAASREAIAFLKRRQLGRATFLPLSVIKGRFISEQDQRAMKQTDGYLGVAADLVQFDETYQSIIYSLLGHVVIAENLEQANRIAARCSYRYRVVTLEGDVVNAGGSMTGGSVQKKSSNLLGRQRQIEELEQQINESEKQLQQLVFKASELKKDYAAQQQRLEELRQTGEQKRLEEQQVRAGLQQIETAERNISQQLAVVVQECALMQQEDQQFVTKKQTLQEQLKQLEVDEQRIHQLIKEAEQLRKANESAKEELQGQLTDLKVKVSAANQEKQSLQDQIARLQQDLAALHSELQHQQGLLARNTEEWEHNEQETVQQVENLNHFRIKKQQCAEQIDFKRAERSNWLKQLEEAESETRQQRIELKQVEEQLHQTEVKVNRMDVELDNILKNLAEDYELSYELAKERYPVPEDVLGTQNVVRELKRKINALGEVNLGAIDEYQRVNERFTFLSEQKADLIEAKQTLYQVIREMEQEMSNRFISTFEEIRGHFVTVFSKLFGGGRADLVLSEPDQLLTTGIDIVAQPPGKKLQNLQLLSGGERALTALALLFAILHVKPVPFCVLDEVEAALDEANVSRFAEYLREFSMQTQFIVVTHRKGTMEEADVLYGVTMEEGGVSKLVSVRLDDEDEEPVSA